MEKLKFSNNIVILGYGTIAKAVLPHIHDHFDIDASQVTVLAIDVPDQAPQNTPFSFHAKVFSKENHEEILETFCTDGDLLVNLTAEISSTDLMAWCAAQGVLYLDTCIELWPDEVEVDNLTYDERKELLDLQSKLPADGPTALSSMGANPGVVSLLTKKIIFQTARDLNLIDTVPTTQHEWAELAKKLGVHTIHVNERDTQYSERQFTPKDFVSTWSVAAMITESIESGEMSIGTHEPGLPAGSQYSGKENTRDIYFQRPGKDVRIKTWLPLAGETVGMILNHNEPYSIAELYTTKDGDYSPTTCFVYHPSDQTMESLKYLTTENYQDFSPHLLLDDIAGGRDELGVFIMTKDHGNHWVGSQLDINTARSINPESSATSLQVAGGVLAGMCWIVQHPNQGIIEPENIAEFEDLLTVAERYWGGFVTAQSAWKPHDSEKPPVFSDFVITSEQSTESGD